MGNGNYSFRKMIASPGILSLLKSPEITLPRCNWRKLKKYLPGASRESQLFDWLDFELDSISIRLNSHLFPN